MKFLNVNAIKITEMKAKGVLSRTLVFHINRALSLIPALKHDINSINTLPHKPKFIHKPTVIFLYILFSVTSNQNRRKGDKTGFSNYISCYTNPSPSRVGKCFLKEDLARYMFVDTFNLSSELLVGG